VVSVCAVTVSGFEWLPAKKKGTEKRKQDLDVVQLPLFCSRIRVQSLAWLNISIPM